VVAGTVMMVLSVAPVVTRMLMLIGYVMPMMGPGVCLLVAVRTHRRRAEHGRRHRTPNREQCGEHDQQTDAKEFHESKVSRLRFAKREMASLGLVTVGRSSGLRRLLVRDVEPYSGGMNIKLVLPLALAMSFGATQAADTGLVDIDWTADGEFAKDLMVAPTKFVEVCGKLAADTKVMWSFDASAPLNFNVHYHEGKKVIFPAKQDGVAKADGVVEAKAPQDYCWMWTNKAAAPATLKLELKRGQ
jgi:hypothetical protein